MSRLRLYADEDAMRRSLVFSLRARSLDVLTAVEANVINRDDEDHLAAAAASTRVLYSFNIADYCVLHQAWIAQKRHHAGSSLLPSSATRWVKSFGESCG